MFSSDQKNNLSKIRETNYIMAEYTPVNFFTITDFNVNLTNNNKLQRTENLSRDFEKDVTENDLNVDLLFEFYKQEKYNKCIRFCQDFLDCFIHSLLKKHTIKPSENFLKNTEKLYHGNCISVSVYFHIVKII
jgi:hypothetical protein